MDSLSTLTTEPPISRRGLNAAARTIPPTDRAHESNSRRCHPAFCSGVPSAQIRNCSIARNSRNCARKDRSSHLKIKSECLLALVAFALLQCSSSLELVRIMPPEDPKTRSVRSALPFITTGVSLYLRGGSPVSDPLDESERPSRLPSSPLARTQSFGSSDQPWPKASLFRGESSRPRDRPMAKAQRRPPKLSRCVERN